MKDAFRPQYDSVPWRHDEADLRSGSKAKPAIHSSMPACGNCSPRIHTTVRMVVASSFCSTCSWIGVGASGTSGHLLDFELASNVGGWQWAAGSGCDAAPYFRVFNPTSQLEKFDRRYEYVKRWVPEFGTSAYPGPWWTTNGAKGPLIYKMALSQSDLIPYISFMKDLLKGLKVIDLSSVLAGP